ncbi:MAG: hydrolase [Shinella sp.]|nr:MAG: hydrolase [Shinella sp.]
MTPHPLEARDKAAAAAARLRPKDAASIILIDRTGRDPRVLVGKRSSKHVFMPDLYVFPGGRRDRRDRNLPFLRDLHPTVLTRLAGGGDDPTLAGRCRALALAALRELEEETGLVIGSFETGGSSRNHFSADLGALRYVARAITPPGNIRRFDTRFFLTFCDETGIDPGMIRDSAELQDLRWLDMHDVSGLNMPAITRTILEDVRTQMKDDPSLPFGSDGPFYFSRRGRFFRDTI